MTVRVLRIVLLIAAAAALGIAAFLCTSRPDQLEINGFFVPEPEPVAAFSLDSATDASFDPDDLKGRWTFLYFGYTSVVNVDDLHNSGLGIGHDAVDNDVDRL